MPRVESYDLDKKLTGKEYVLGTDTDKNNKTSSYKLNRIKDFVLDTVVTDPLGGVPNANGTFTWLKYSLFSDGRDASDEVSMSDIPLEGDILYIGLAYDKLTADESDIPEDYIWSDASGSIVDANGLYTWLKYADTKTSGMSDNPLGKTWIGFSFHNEEIVESLLFEDYEWTKVSANDGNDGVPIAGTTKFAWFKYSIFPLGLDLNNESDMVDIPTPQTIYLGIAYNKDTHEESDIPADYEWSLLGSDIIQANGLYTWVKYAYTPTSEMSDLPDGMKYIGFAFDKATTESADPASDLNASYQWSAMYMDINGNEDGHQNNITRVVRINTEDLINRAITESSVADYFNRTGIKVKDTENILLDFYTATGPVPDIPDPIDETDYSLNLEVLVLNISAVTETTADFEWAINNTTDPNIVAYKLIYTHQNGQSYSYPVSGRTTDTSFQATGLDNNTTYNVYLIAYSTVTGDTKTSVLQSFTTLETITPSVPNLNFTDLTDTTIDLTWSIDDAFGADNFKVFQGVTKIYDGFDTTFDVTGLTASTAYIFSVIAYNAGTPSTETFLNVTTEAAPAVQPLSTPLISVIQNFSNSLDLNFSVANAFVYEYNRITHWKLQYQALGNSTFNTDTFLLDVSTPYNLGELIPSTRYTLKVASYDVSADVTSSYSTSIVGKTLPLSVNIGASLQLSTNTSPTNEGFVNIFEGQLSGTATVRVGIEVYTANQSKILNEGSITFPNISKTVTRTVDQDIVLALDSTGRTASNGSSSVGYFTIDDTIGNSLEGAIYFITATIISSANGINSLKKSKTVTYQIDTNLL